MHGSVFNVRYTTKYNGSPIGTTFSGETMATQRMGHEHLWEDPLESAAAKHAWILVATDHFTKWVKAKSC